MHRVTEMWSNWCHCEVSLDTTALYTKMTDLSCTHCKSLQSVLHGSKLRDVQQTAVLLSGSYSHHTWWLHSIGHHYLFPSDLSVHSRNFESKTWGGRRYMVWYSSVTFGENLVAWQYVPWLMGSLITSATQISNDALRTTTRFQRAKSMSSTYWSQVQCEYEV